MTTPGSPRHYGDPVPPDTTPIVNPALYRRQPLGLPTGSVRAVLSLMVMGLVCALLVIPDTGRPAFSIPVYLYFLMFLIVGHYFGARSHTAVPAPHAAAPWHLPRGTFRVLIVLGLIGAVAYGAYYDEDFLRRLQPDFKDLEDHPYLAAVILGAFFLGIVLARAAYHLVGSSGGVPSWLQDVVAWVSMLAVLGLVAEVIIQLVINPTLDNPLRLPVWQGILSAIVAFYFGVRS
ncbi:MAG TPA: hypothetical protein VG013_40740 [Gemmataceae bacterium]|nr:hypothetical protein [Gemmataceae bacterium]